MPKLLCLFTISLIFIYIPILLAIKCPTILYPTSLHIIPQASTLHILLSHDRQHHQNSKDKVSIEAFPTGQKLTPLPRTQLLLPSALRNFSETTTLTISAVNLPLGSYGLQLHIDQHVCSQFVFISIVPLQQQRLQKNTGKMITILSPSEGVAVPAGKVYVHIGFHPSIKRFCLQLSHIADQWCFKSEIAQPLLIENIETHSHILKVWSEENASTNDVVVFDVEPLGHVPFVEILTPLPGQVVPVDSVWLKFQVRPTVDSSMLTLCIALDNGKEFCDLDSNSPHQLHNIRAGDHRVCVWIATQADGECREFNIGRASTSAVADADADADAEVDRVCQDDTNMNEQEIVSHVKKIPDTQTFLIVVFACSRPNHLRSLWESLLQAQYDGHTVGLRVVVDQPKSLLDRNDYLNVIEFVNTTMRNNWNQGPIEISFHTSPHGLKRSVLEFWTPKDDSHQHHDERLIFLEDDVVVSRYFFQYLVNRDYQLQTYTSNKYRQQVIGISLYRPQWNEVSWTPFTTNNCTSFMLQLPCSWGAVYYAEKWALFLQWYQHQQQNTSPLILPRSTTNNWDPKTSWKIFMLRFMLEHDLHMWYPNDASYSTTTTPAGTNMRNPSGLSALFNVPLSTCPISSIKIAFHHLRWFDIHHQCRSGNCINQQAQTRKREIVHNVTTMQCEGDDDTSTCFFEHVGFDATTEKTIEVYNPSSAFKGPKMKMIPSSYRHRCCMDDIVDIFIQEQPLFKQCDAKNTVQTTTFMIGIPFLPQYGHSLHDFILSLYSSLLSTIENITGIQEKKSHLAGNVQVILTNSNVSLKTLATHTLVVLLRNMITRHQVWTLKEFMQQRELAKVCFRRLTYGTSSKANLYVKNNIHHEFIHVRQFVQRTHILFGAVPSLLQQKTSPQFHLVTRATSRRISNLKDVVHAAEEVFGITHVTASDFSGTFAQQYATFRKVDVLAAVHGTALINALFLSRTAVIIHLMPWGTHRWMGQNTKRAAMLWDERTLLLLVSKDPYSSVYTTPLQDEYGHPIVGKTLVKMHQQLALKPEELWSTNWMHGFSFFVNVDEVNIDVGRLVPLLNMAKEAAKR